MFDFSQIDPNQILITGVGAVVIGILAHAFDPGEARGGLVGTVIAAMVGALIGWMIVPLARGYMVTGFDTESLLAAMGGALVVAIVERVMMRDMRHIKTTSMSMSKGGKSRGERE